MEPATINHCPDHRINLMKNFDGDMPVHGQAFCVDCSNMMMLDWAYISFPDNPRTEYWERVNGHWHQVERKNLVWERSVGKDNETSIET